MPPQGESLAVGLGSGVTIDCDGYLPTNAHVVADADALTVTLMDKREFKGRVLGARRAIWL